MKCIYLWHNNSTETNWHSAPNVSASELCGEFFHAQSWLGNEELVTAYILCNILLWCNKLNWRVSRAWKTNLFHADRMLLKCFCFVLCWFTLCWCDSKPLVWSILSWCFACFYLIGGKIWEMLVCLFGHCQPKFKASCFVSTALQNGDTLSLCYQKVLLVWNHVCNYVFIQFIKWYSP